MIPIFKPTPAEDELREIKDSFDSHWIGLGPKTKKFEQEFCNYTGAKNAVSLNSCTAALHLCLDALGIGEGDEVLISSITFASTGHAVIFTGAIPILVDVNEDDLQMDIEDLKRKISPKTKAIIPVHYGGLVCDIDPIIQIARENNLYVIEDAANVAGASYKDKKIGGLDSDFTCFSFEAKKNMTTGDGGMITTNHEGEIIDKINRLKWVGMDKDTAKRFAGGSESKPWDYDITDLGFKYNMNDITASMGLVQLKRLDNMNIARRRLVERYNQAFQNVSWLRIMKEKPYAHNVYWLYILRLEDGNRDKMMKHLLDKEVLANTNFKPLHLFSYYEKYYKQKGIQITCPVAEREWNKLFVLPLYPTMTGEEQDKVIEAVKSFKQTEYNPQTIAQPTENVSASTNLEGVRVITPEVYNDERGYFTDIYNKNEFSKAGIDIDFVQNSQVMSKRAVLRGFHFQKQPHVRAKTFRVIKGKVLQVVVDLRQNSPTYGKWFSAELSEENKKIIFIPEGCASGYLSLEDETIIQYQFAKHYNLESQAGMRFNDPDVGVDWQLEKYGLREDELIINNRDRQFPFFREISKF